MKAPSFLAILLILILVPVVQAKDLDFSGIWIIDREASTAIDPWRKITLDIGIEGHDLTLERTVSTGRRTHTNRYALEFGRELSVDMGWWIGNRHIGAYTDRDTKGTVRVEWLDDGASFRVESNFYLITSQGKTKVRTYEEYRLSAEGEELTVIQLRSSRNKPIVHVFRRPE